MRATSTKPATSLRPRVALLYGDLRSFLRCLSSSRHLSRPLTQERIGTP